MFVVSLTLLMLMPSVFALATSHAQAPFHALTNSTEFRGLQQLYQGNQKFRDARLTQTETDPGFMFIGCTDNRLSPSHIFNAASGSIITHNNIGNQYSSKDSSVTAAVSYAVESSQVQHIIVLGHYGCKGAEMAITKSQKASKFIKTWIKPISELYSTSRRLEIAQLRDSRKPHREQAHGIKEAPPSSDAGYRALVQENVKRSVKELRNNSLLAKAYAKPSTNKFDVFVHGFVFDESTGEVINLSVSFGPPGKPIPHLPFKAIAAAQSYLNDKYS